VPYSTFEKAQQAAEDRRERLRSFLSEYSNVRAVGLEFIELPPSWDVPVANIRRGFLSDEAEAYWHTSRLHLQLNRDEDLLIERVIDVLDYLVRVQKISPSEFPSNVRLEKTPRRLMALGKFPWRVAISTNHPELLVSTLSQVGVAEWLGIGVDCEPIISAKHSNKNVDNETPPHETPTAMETGRCKEGFDGLEGSIGGIVYDGDDHTGYGITCRHVVSSSCPRVAWPDNPIRPPDDEFTQQSPDVAFIRMDEDDCFSEARVLAEGLQPPVLRMRVTVLSQAEITAAVALKTKFRKAPLRDKRRGIVSAGDIREFKLGNHMYRGPHVAINPPFYERFFIAFPLVSRIFSKHGHSGSWVIDEVSRCWLGVLVGSQKPPNTTSYVVAGYYVLDAFKRKYPSAILKPEALLM
jgi:hypothetical protein